MPGGTVVTASPLVNFASLPAYFALEFIDDVFPIAPLLTVLWGFLAYFVARWGWDWASPRLGRGRPVWTHQRAAVGLNPGAELLDWLRRTTPVHRWLLGAVSVVTVWQAWVVPPFDYTLWGEAMAIQMTALVAAAAAVVAFHSLLRLLFADWVAHVGAGLLLTATPLVYWGTQIKYHGLMMSLVVFALYLYTLGWKRNRLGFRALAVVCGGLAVWNHLSGVFLVAGLGLAELVHAGWPRDWRRLRAWRPRARSHAVAVVALVVGLVPWMVYNNEMFGNPLTDHYFASGETSGLDEAVTSGNTSAVGDKLDATQERYGRYYTYQREFRDGLGPWRGTLTIYFLAHEAEGTALAVFALTPVMVLALLAPVAAWRTRGREGDVAQTAHAIAANGGATAVGPVGEPALQAPRTGEGGTPGPPGTARHSIPWSPAATIAVGIIVANWFFYVQRGPFQGAGYDLRYFTMSVPCLLFLAMMGLRWAVRDGRMVVRSAMTTYAAGGMVVFAMLLAMAHKNFLLDWTDEFKQTYVVMHVLGAVSLTGIFLAAIGRPAFGRFQQPVLGAYLGLGLLTSHMWVATTMVLFHTGIPAHGAYPTFSHLLPLTHLAHELIRDWLIPPKWG